MADEPPQMPPVRNSPSPSKVSSKASPTGPTTARVLGMGIELGVVIGGATYLGYLGDRYFDTQPWLALTGALLGMTGGCYNVIREVLKQEQRKVGIK